MESKLILKSNIPHENLSKSLGAYKEDITKTLKLWQIALLIGIPSTAILAYIYYKSSKKNQQKSIKEKDLVEQSNNKPKKNSKNDEFAHNREDEKKQSKLNVLDKSIEMKNQGNKYFQQGKFEEAVTCYSEAIEFCPKNDREELPKFYQNRAAAYDNLRQFEKVIEDCNSALKLDPKYTKALMRRAKAFENLGMLQPAFEDLTALCILEKFSSSTMASADKMVKKIGEKMAKDIFKNRSGLPISKHFVNNFFVGLNNDIVFNNDEFYQKVFKSNSNEMLNALNDFNTGKYTECIQNCTEVLKHDNEFKLEARNLRGSLYMLKCQYKEALEDFNFVLNDSSSSNRIKSNTYIKLTALNLQNNQEHEAFTNYEKAIEIDPTNEDIYCNRAQVYAMKGRFEECFKDFDKCIELNSDHKIAKLQKAFFEFRQFFAQLSLYKQATEGDKTSWIHTSKELKQETSKLERLLEEFSEVPEAYNLYAQILSEQENYEKAENYYKVALQRDPENAALIVQRALNLMSWKNEFDESITMLNEAIKIDETCEFAYETLATIEIQRGNLQKAVELFEKAIQLTRSEDSMTNLCCMLIGAQTQFKVLNNYSNAVNLEIF